MAVYTVCIGTARTGWLCCSFRSDISVLFRREYTCKVPINEKAFRTRCRRNNKRVCDNCFFLFVLHYRDSHFTGFQVHAFSRFRIKLVYSWSTRFGFRNVAKSCILEIDGRIFTNIKYLINECSLFFYMKKKRPNPFAAGHSAKKFHFQIYEYKKLKRPYNLNEMMSFKPVYKISEKNTHI